MEDENNVDDKRHLTFKQVGENTFRIFNKKTGRFHDMELGIDMIY